MSSLKPHALTPGHAAHHKRPQTSLEGGVYLVSGDHCHHADSHVEGPEHFRIAHPPRCLQPLEDLRRGPGGAVNGAAQVGALGEDAWQVFWKAATGDVAQPLCTVQHGWMQGRLADRVRLCTQCEHWPQWLVVNDTLTSTASMSDSMART